MEICDFVIESGSFVRRIFKEFFPRGGGGGIFLVPFFLFFFWKTSSFSFLKSVLSGKRDVFLCRSGGH